MTDYYVQGSFSFHCTTAEAALIKEAFRLDIDLIEGFEPDQPSPGFAALFPDSPEQQRFDGFRALFDDPAFPTFGAEIEVEHAPGDEKICVVSIFGNTDFQPDPIAALIKRCCQDSLAIEPVGFAWSYSASRARADAYGGGWCVVFPDRIEMETTAGAISRAKDVMPGSASRGDPWRDDPRHPVSDWKYEVASDDTRLGYLAWIAARIENDGGKAAEAAPTGRA